MARPKSLQNELKRDEILDVAAQCSRGPAATAKSWRQKILTSEDAVGVHRALQDAFDDFAWSAAA